MHAFSWLKAAALLAILFTPPALAGNSIFNANEGAQETAEPKSETPASEENAEADDQPVDAAQSFIDGNLHFIVYHEMGHALVSEFELPVLGREEDAVDRLAIWMMTPQEGEEEPEYLQVAIKGWLASADGRPIGDVAWWGEHGTDEQRAYQIACLLYGWNPKLYAPIADEVKLPEERRVSCEEESKSNDKAWMTALQPHFSAEGAPRATGTVRVEYAETTTFAEELAYLKELGLLEHVAELMETQYTFKPGITVAAIECGQPNAFWNASERKLMMCYELVDYFQQLTVKLKL